MPHQRHAPALLAAMTAARACAGLAAGGKVSSTQSIPACACACIPVGRFVAGHICTAHAISELSTKVGERRRVASGRDDHRGAHRQRDGYAGGAEAAGRAAHQYGLAGPHADRGSGRMARGTCRADTTW